MLFQDRKWKNWAAINLKPQQDSLVLDIGCGTLVFEERLENHSVSFVCLDLAPDMLRMGRRKNLPNVQMLLNGDAEYLPFPDGSFEFVVSCYVAKYVGIEKFARELARVTRSGGRAVVYDLCRPRGPLSPFLEMYIQCGLRIIGHVLAHTRNRGAFTFMGHCVLQFSLF